MEAVEAYYRATEKGRNAVATPFGPAPLLAVVSTREIKAGSEVLMSYGAACES